ncbi:MAG: porin [Candidatus Hydrogenedentes bacterium]|nr:porin [Candidatus Hydrogenedentota bacterium]
MGRHGLVTARRLCRAGLVAALGWACVVSAQDPAPSREEALLNRVEQLEARIAELEQRLAQQAPEAPPAAELEQRIEKVEQALEAEADKPASDFRTYWKDGLRFETEDGRFKLRIGGRLQCDWAFYHQDRDLKHAVGDEQDGAEFRLARIRLEGTLYGDVVFRSEYDFAGNDGDAKFKDVYLGLQHLPWVGNVKVGHIREPFGLERCTGVSEHTFMELALPCVFAPNRNLGVLLHNDVLDSRATWAIGAFKEVDDFPSDDDSDEDQGYAVTARITGLPWYRDEGRRLLHLGVAYSHRNPDGDDLGGPIAGWQTRPESHLANRYVNTDAGAIEGYRIVDTRLDDIDLFGAEAALIWGPLSVQGEYMAAAVDSDFAGHLGFDGYYVQAGYFLTGEHRPYKNAAGVFGRVHPKRNFSLKGERGWGAWELAARYSALDLNDGAVRGGEEQNVTIGLNWYLNPCTRIMWNYVRADVDHDLYEGNVDIFQTRFQVDF